jgi:hypothetical protein
MCTVSWVHEGDGYQLFCNRDEKRSRARAFLPRTECRDGVYFIAPVDAEAGGTWIGTNELGISVCILNGSNRRNTKAVRSRGLLLPELLSAGSSIEVAQRVSRAELTAFAPFVLAVLEPGQSTTVIHWDGGEKSILPYGEPYMPLTSSSVDPGGARAARHEDFRRRVAAAGRLDWSVLLDFHESHGAAPNACSPCMHRKDAETVSFSWVRVTAGRVEFLYKPTAPCRPALAESLTLPRKQ